MSWSELLLDDRQVELVTEFHVAAGVPIRSYPPKDGDLEPLERRKLQSLLDQELGELRKALHGEGGPGVNQVLSIADAVGDIAYVCIGAALQLGIDVLTSTSVSADRLGIAIDGQGDEITSLDTLAELYWSARGVRRRPPMSTAARAYRRGTDPQLVDDVDQLLTDLHNGGSSFKSGLSLFDLSKVAVALGDILMCCFVLACRLGFHLGTVFEEIHRSNMTKVSTSVRRRSDGKILKGREFEPPDLRHHTEDE